MIKHFFEIVELQYVISEAGTLVEEIVVRREVELIFSKVWVVTLNQVLDHKAHVAEGKC